MMLSTWFKRHKLFTVLFLILGALAIFCARNVFKFTYFGSHDGDYMLVRAFVARQMLSEGQIPLRWSGSLQYGCGAPVFTFFYPLFAYIVGGLSLLTGVSVALLMKGLYGSFFILGAVGFFLWAHRETKDDLASFLGATLYLLAPYRFVLVFVRGSMEGLGYALLPFVMLAIKLVYDRPKSAWRWVIAILIGTAFFLSHNIVVFFSIPIILGYILFLKLKGHDLRLGAVLVGFWIALSLFFWGPALLEQRFTKLPDQKTAILSNLPMLKQLIYSPWDFGPVNPANAEHPYPTGITFSLGFGQWAILGIGSALLLVLLLQRRSSGAGLLVLSIGITLFLVFLDSNASRLIWKSIPGLSIIQFPWRLLGFCVFFSAVVGAVVVSMLRETKLKVLVVLISASLAFFNVRNYMGANPSLFPEVYEDVNKHHFRNGTATVADEILPAEQPLACPVGFEWIEGEGLKITSRKFQETNGLILFDSDKTGAVDVKLPLSYFPGIYDLNLNGKETEITQKDGMVALSQAMVVKGENKVEWQIHETSQERVFTIISLVSFVWMLLFISLLLWYSSRQRKYENLRRDSRP